MRQKQKGQKNAKKLHRLDFISEEAKLRYEQGLQQRSFAQEKGFLVADEQLLRYPSYITSIIQERKWEKFCEVPGAAVKNIVREFYANFEGDLPECIQVRKCDVRFGPSAINNFYNLEEVEDEFYKYVDNLSSEFLDAALKEIAVPGTEWVQSKTGYLSIPRLALLPKAKVWYHFVKLRLFPSSHGQHLTRERAILLYCLLTNKKINVGLVIYRNLCTNALKPKGQLLFPSLVSGLCEMAGVMYDADEEELSPGPVMTPSIIRRIASEGLGAGEPEAEEQAASGTAASSSNSNTQQQILATLGSVRFKLEWNRMDLSRLQKSMKSLKRKNRIFWEYTKLRDSAIAASLAKKPKAPAPIFPQFPTTLLQDSDDESEPAEMLPNSDDESENEA